MHLVCYSPSSWNSLHISASLPLFLFANASDSSFSPPRSTTSLFVLALILNLTKPTGKGEQYFQRSRIQVGHKHIWLPYVTFRHRTFPVFADVCSWVHRSGYVYWSASMLAVRKVRVSKRLKKYTPFRYHRNHLWSRLSSLRPRCDWVEVLRTEVNCGATFAH